MTDTRHSKHKKIPRITLQLKISLFLLIALIVPLIIVFVLFYVQIQQSTESVVQGTRGVYVTVERMKTLGLIGVVSAIMLMFPLAILLVKSILKPVKVLLASMNKLERGDMRVRAVVEANDELGDLAEAFDRMIKSVNRKTVSVKMLSEDITMRKGTEVALVESEQKFRGLVENINDVVFQLSPDGVFQYVSPAIEKLYGYKSEDIMGRNIEITTPPEEMPKVKNVISAILKGENVQGWELNQVDKKGTIVCMEVSAAPLSKDNKIIAILGVMRDITERKKAQVRLQQAYDKLKETQAQLIQVEKLQVVGTMASGVAHEVKNPLAIIMSGVDYLEGEMGENKKTIAPILKMIAEAVERADGIIRGMLDFSRPAPLQLKSVELNKIVEKSYGLVGRQLNLKNTKVTLKLAAELPLVMVDANQMQQVFINIILNAEQAMPKGGEITIRTFTKELTKESYVDTGVFKAGDNVIVCEVKDTGTGIPKNKLDKVFDPFFTTKPVGKGTGLGLTIIRTIVEKHNGNIHMESEEGKGTKVIIILPIIK